jgi:P27 family predicted phage terminase small subunit
LYDAGLLTSVDRDALALYCSAFARWREAEAKLVTDGLIVTTNVKTDKNGDVIGGGNEVQSPYLAVANRAQETMIKLQEQFGMTPSSRMRVSIAKPDAQRAAKAAVNMGETAEVAEALQVLTA